MRVETESGCPDPQGVLSRGVRRGLVWGIYGVITTDDQSACGTHLVIYRGRLGRQMNNQLRRAIVFVIVDKIDFVKNILALFILKEYGSREHNVVDVIWDFFHVSFILAVSVGVGCVCMRVSVCERDIELEEDIHVCIIFIVDKHK